jgi:hypothetical protein
VLWATGGQSDQWQWQTDFGANFCGKIWEAWRNLGQLEANLTNGRQILVRISGAKFGKHKAWQNLNQEPASEGNM